MIAKTKGWRQEPIYSEAVKNMNKGKIFQVDYEFASDHNIAERTAQSTTIHFRATGDKTAVKGAIAWWANRHKNVPSHFQRCYAVKVFEFDPSPLDDDGYQSNSGRIRMLFQWKIDTGCGPGVTIGTKLVDDPTIDIFNIDNPAKSVFG